MCLGVYIKKFEEPLNVTDILQFLDRLYMSQIRNVVLIIIATAIMAIVTSIVAYFFDYLTSVISGSIARKEYTHQLYRVRISQ